MSEDNETMDTFPSRLPKKAKKTAKSTKLSEEEARFLLQRESGIPDPTLDEEARRYSFCASNSGREIWRINIVQSHSSSIAEHDQAFH
jgi:hypothetical protein